MRGSASTLGASTPWSIPDCSVGRSLISQLLGLQIRRNCTLFRETPPEWATEGSCRIDLFMTKAERTPRDFLASKTVADLLYDTDAH